MNTLKVKRFAAGAALAGALAATSVALGSGQAGASDTFWIPQPPGPVYGDAASAPSSLNTGQMPRISVPGHWNEP
jgi:hypothetical protein